MEDMVPAVRRTPAEPTARAAPRLSTSDPPHELVVVRLATVRAPGVVGNVSVNVAPVRATVLPLDSTI